MTRGWDSKPLGDLCEVLDSQRRPVTKKDRRPGEYPYYGATGIVDYVDEFIFDEQLVLVGEDGAKWGSGDGTAFSVSGRCWVNNHAHVLRPDRRKLLDAWLVHFLVHEDLSRFVSGLTVPKLNQGNLREIPIPLPPLPEQRRIVAILDEVFEAIATAKANTEKNLQNAREVFEAFTASIFQRGGASWQQGSLKSFAEAISTGPFGSLLHKSDYVSDGVPLVNPINIVDGLIVPDPNKLVDTETRQRLQSYILRAGDIVVGRRGEIGRCAVVGPNEEGWVCGTGCFFIRPGSAIRPELIAHLIRSPEYRARLERASTGATMKNLSNTALGELLIAVPALSEQDQLLALIGRLSEECGRAESVSEQKLAALDELKKSLLHQAFTGQLTSKVADQQLEALA